MELYITGYAGLTGSQKIYQNEETRKKLLDHYPKSFFTVLEKKIPEFPSAGCAGPENLSDGSLPGIRDQESAAEGGVFGAMWRLLKRNQLGAGFDQKKIPLLQQTVEICEYFGLDPYRMEAGTCMLWLAEDPVLLEKYAKETGIRCERIGFTAKGPGIRRTDGESIACLRRPEEGNSGSKTDRGKS